MTKKTKEEPLTVVTNKKDKGGETQVINIRFNVVLKDLGKGVNVAGIQIETKGLELHITPLGLELLLMSLAMDNEELKKAMIKAVGKMVMGDVYGYSSDKLPNKLQDIDLDKIKPIKS